MRSEIVKKILKETSQKTKNKVLNCVQSILCAVGKHDYYKWQPYPKHVPEITINRCKHCDSYEWR